jgi:hypothetical protein
MLTNFSICKGRSVYKFVEMYPNLVIAAVKVYLTSELGRIKNVDEFLAFDGETAAASTSPFAAIFLGIKKFFLGLSPKAQEALVEKAVEASDSFLTWLGEETGIGRAEGNTEKSGGLMWAAWEYFPNNPKNSYPQPVKNYVSKNYLENVWKKALIDDGIKDGTGWNFELEQRALPIYFSKIKAGYYKNTAEWHKVVTADLKVANDKKALKDLNKNLGSENSNPLGKIFSKLIGK